MRKIISRGLIGCLCIFGCGTLLWAEPLFKKPSPANRPRPDRQRYASDHVLIKFRQNVTATDLRKFQAQVRTKVGSREEALAAFHAAYGTQPQRKPVFGWQRVRLPESQSVAGAREQLATSSLVEAVEPDYLAYACLESTTYTAHAYPNDTYYHDGYSQWWLDRTYADEAMNSGFVFTGSSVVVAVVDTGVQLNHPEFTTPVSRLVAGYNAITPAAQPADDDGHGTFVAGLIAANADNSSMIAGTAYQTGIKVMPIKVLDYTGSGVYSDIADGIQWAVDQGARVISMSFGGYYNSALMSNACTYAANAGCFLVAAAGNDYTDLTADPFYPACYSSVLAVAATDAQNYFTSYTNYGLGIIDLAAPGGDMYYPDPDFRDNGIVSTYLGSTVTALNGTSFSAPQISAAAALLWLQVPGRTADDLKTILTSHCQNPRSQSAKYVGAGIINIQAALAVYQTSTRTRTPTVTRTATASASATRTPTISPTPTITRTATISATVTWSPSISATPTISSTATATPSATVSATISLTPTHSASTTVTSTLTPAPTLTRTPTGSAVPTRTVTATPMNLGPGRIRVYPSPARNYLRILFDVHGRGLARADLYNALGERVLHLEAAPVALAGSWGLELATRKIGTGVYYLTLKVRDDDGERNFSRRVAIMH